MKVRIPVCCTYLLVIDLRKPVVRGYGSAVGEDETAYAVVDGAVLLDAPVIGLEIAVNGLLVVYHVLLGVSDVLMLLAVEDVVLCNVAVAAKGKRGLHAVLNGLDPNLAVLDL